MSRGAGKKRRLNDDGGRVPGPGDNGALSVRSAMGPLYASGTVRRGLVLSVGRVSVLGKEEPKEKRRGPRSGYFGWLLGWMCDWGGGGGSRKADHGHDQIMWADAGTFLPAAPDQSRPGHARAEVILTGPDRLEVETPEHALLTCEASLPQPFQNAPLLQVHMAQFSSTEFFSTYHGESKIATVSSATTGIWRSPGTVMQDRACTLCYFLGPAFLKRPFRVILPTSLKPSRYGNFLGTLKMSHFTLLGISVRTPGSQSQTSRAAAPRTAPADALSRLMLRFRGGALTIARAKLSPPRSCQSILAASHFGHLGGSLDHAIRGERIALALDQWPGAVHISLKLASTRLSEGRWSWPSAFESLITMATTLLRQDIRWALIKLHQI
ncbi:hypothetical protein GGX14DRAFT_398499 [Mycena pura]|uniref:Uncharacterized protein n=1 Tax=Mycena pura TaxID=153505 RepID=A0AAD6Y9S0_9AGAR|nr:hypothetical protein GGX14DRAFT_398499 [Mycena pura]